MAAQTLYDKIWDAHVVSEADGEAILYIDLHLIHEVITPQAFENGGTLPFQSGCLKSVRNVCDHPLALVTLPKGQ